MKEATSGSTISETRLNELKYQAKTAREIADTKAKAATEARDAATRARTIANTAKAAYDAAEKDLTTKKEAEAKEAKEAKEALEAAQRVFDEAKTLVDTTEAEAKKLEAAVYSLDTETGISPQALTPAQAPTTPEEPRIILSEEANAFKKIIELGKIAKSMEEMFFNNKFSIELCDK